MAPVSDIRNPERIQILVISQHYRPEPNFITADVAEALAADARVTVVTGHPNYPHGRFYPGVRWWLPQRSEENGVTVWRIPFMPDRSASPLRRMIAYLSFALAAALFAPWIAGRPDVVWVYQGPFTAILATPWFRFVLRSRVVLTCADLWPESFQAVGYARAGPLLRACYAYRRASNRLAHTIIASTRTTMQRFAAEGYPPERLHHVPIWVEGMSQAAEPRSWEGGTPVIVYAGNIGPAQQLETVLKAAAILRDEARDVRFDLYGSGPEAEKLQLQAATLNLDNVRFLGMVPPHRAFEASAASFAQLVTLKPTPHFAGTVPSKLFMAFAACSPILCGVEGEASRLVRESAGGIVFKPGSGVELAAAVSRLLAMSPGEQLTMRQSLHRYYRRHLDRAASLDQYRQLIGAHVPERSLRRTGRPRTNES